MSVLIAILSGAALGTSGCRGDGTDGADTAVRPAAPAPEAAVVPPAVPAPARAGAPSSTAKPPKPRAGAEDWGIEALSLRPTAAGYMLNFRYRVTDPAKAAPLMNRTQRPHLVDQRTGATLIVPAPPKVGALRSKSDRPQAGRTYFVMFANPGRYLQPGDRVTIALGDAEFRDVVIE